MATDNFCGIHVKTWTWIVAIIHLVFAVLGIAQIVVQVFKEGNLKAITQE